MVKVVSIKRRRELRIYYDAGKNNRIEDTFFLIGFILTAILPEIIYSAEGGPILAIAFTGIALVGSIWGLVMHYKSSSPFVSCVGTGTVPEAPPGKDIRPKAA